MKIDDMSIPDLQEATRLLDDLLETMEIAIACGELSGELVRHQCTIALIHFTLTGPAAKRQNFRDKGNREENIDFVVRVLNLPREELANAYDVYRAQRDKRMGYRRPVLKLVH